MIRNVHSRIAFATALLAVGTSCAPASAPAGFVPAPGATRAAIDAEDLRTRVGILAHDSLRGRDTGTPGIASAARYLAGEMERLGLRPAGDDGTYYQSVPLERRFTRAAVNVSSGDQPARALGPDRILSVSGLGGLPRAMHETASGPIVFAGHLLDPSPGAELTAGELAGAVVIVRLGVPSGVDPATAMPRLSVASLFGPTSPAAAILLVAEETEEDFWNYAQDIERKGAVALATGAPAGPTGPAFFLLSAEEAELILGAGLAGARRPQAGFGSFDYRLQESVEPIEGWNIAAVLPGADPARANEYVGLGGHYDHVGVGTPVDGDSIYSGADDNASGTSALLEVAEALAHLPQTRRPARSILFVWKTAEEAGLLGSEYFTDHPTVPRESIVAHINLDMVGRNHPDSIFVVGTRRIATELGDIVEAANARQARPFTFDYSYDAPGHPEQIFCRSDHYNYARYGIPIVFFTTGLHDDYHAPSDVPERIDYDKAARVGQLVLDLTTDLANRAEPPRVDQPVPPLGTPCS